MPQIYPHPEPRRRSSSSASSSSFSSSPTVPQRMIDADDSIILSDLVRTGEVSRLRRRGAMRLDHNSVNNNLGPNVQTRNIIVVDRPNWDSDYDFDLTAEGHLGRSNSMRYTRRRQRSSRRYGPYSTGIAPDQEQAEEDVYTLVCGAEILGEITDNVEPFKPSILPLYPPPQQAKDRVTKRSSGCGSVLHLRATPRPRVGIWSACGAASSAVVPLDANYFHTREAAKFVRSSCGCVKEGIGCAVCGNPLGTRYMPCKSASDSFFCARHNDKSHLARLRGPEGPQYWQASTAQTSDHTIFSFFIDSVTSTPSYTFPPKKQGVRPRVYSNASDESLNLTYSPPAISQLLPDPVLSEDEGDSFGRTEWQSDFLAHGEDSGLQPPSNMILDRFAASSPAPLSDNGDEIGPTWSQPRIRTSHARRPHIHTGPTFYEGATSHSYSPAVSFYQQQVIGAWERERERDRENNRTRPVGRSFDPDGESFVWGVVDPEVGAPEIQEPGSPDKTTERFLFPER